MKDLTLIDIEEKIYNRLISSYDIDQEALDYIENHLEDISSFGSKEEETIISAREKALSGIKTYLLVSIIPLIKKIVIVFSKTNLHSLENNSLASIFSFLSPLKQHNKSLRETEKLFAELLEKRKDYVSILELFDNIQKEQIHLLERIDKKIFLGKSTYHHLCEKPEKHTINLQKLQRRIFKMELTKNIPLQIITKIQNAEEIVNSILEYIDTNLTPDFSSYISTYEETLMAFKEKKERKDLKKLIALYQNILVDIKKLEILDEDLEEKFNDLKESLPLLLT